MRRALALVAARRVALAGCGGDEPAARRRGRLDRALDARRPRRRRLPRSAGPASRCATRTDLAPGGRAGPRARHASGSSPTPTCATRSRPRGCRSWTASARRSPRPSGRRRRSRRRCSTPPSARWTASSPQAVFVTGDIVDNAQANELDAGDRACSRGGRVDPDSGAPGYDGVQAADDPDPFYYRPDVDAPRHPGLLAAAQRPFRAAGLRAPWYPAIGNHDVLVQGEVAAHAGDRAVAIGDRLVTALDPRLRPPTRRDVGARRGGRLLAAERAPRATAARARRPGAAAAHGARGRTAAAPCERCPAPRRPARLHVRHRRARARHRARHGRGATAARAARSTRAELAWLRGELAARGRPLGRRLHPQPARGSDGGPRRSARSTADPRVVAVVAGNRHRNTIEPDARRGGYWLIGTSSLADFPQQARMFRLCEIAGGGVVLETWMVDHDGRGVAGPARELAYLDAQGGRPQRLRGTPRRTATPACTFPPDDATSAAGRVLPAGRAAALPQAADRTSRSSPTRCRRTTSWCWPAAWPRCSAGWGSWCRAPPAWRAGG